MPNFGQQLLAQGAGAVGNLVGTGMGLLLENHNDRRQIQQQQKLTDMQLLANKSMAQFNYEQQLKLWNATNYSAQMEQLRKAGLNPGLLYGMSGGVGATTAAAQGGPATGAQAPSGGGEIMGLMAQKMQMAMMEAQIENVKADTQNKLAETPNIPKTGLKIDTEIQQLKQLTKNAQAQEQLTKTQNDIATTEAKLKSDSLENAIQLVRLQMQNEDQKWREAIRNNSIGDEVRDTIVKTIQQTYAKLLLEKALIQQQTTESKSRVQVNESTIKQIAYSIAQGWEGLAIGLQGKNTEHERLSYEKFVNDIQKSTGLGIELVEKIIQAVTLRGLFSPQTQRNPIGFRP